MDSTGDFVIAWDLASTSTDIDIQAQRFTSTGSPRGGVITVASSGKAETEPSAAVDGNGNFVVAYTLAYSATDSDVMAKMYNDAGAVTKTITVADTARNELHPSVSRSPDGRFAVAYQDNYSSIDPDIKLKRYASSGSLVNTHDIATSSDREESPSVAMDDNGNVVVAWQQLIGSDRDIKARRVSNNGSVGSIIAVRATSAVETNPSVAINRTDGSFVVAYEVGSGNSRSVSLTEISGTNSNRGTSSAGTGRAGTALSRDGSNNYFITYTNLVGTTTDPLNGIRGRFFRTIV